jgi:DNA repair protein RecN (Recombination protein N)
VLLAGKEAIPTLIFDEIDANIGGRTATIVAKKLRKLGERHQILCITHFSQVAREADQQLVIEKETLSGRTMTSIRPVDPADRELELARMRGDA